MTKTLLVAAALAGLLLTASAGAVPPVFATPDQADMIRAARSLQDGFEKDAYDKYLRAASYGNKEAQKNLGLMYIKGLGVAKDWARAYAWMKLAATRNEAQYISARDEIWGALRDDEKETAEAHYAQLEAEYGDVVALKRRERWVRRQKREVTGSRVGNIGALRVQVADATGYQWELSGQEFFEVLDTYLVDLRAHLGEVELRELEVIEDDLDNQ